MVIPQPIASKDWIDVLSAVLPPTSALVALAIAFLQWHLHRSKLRYEVFDRRYRVFDAVKGFVQLKIKQSSLSDTQCCKLLQEAKGADFLFRGDIGQFLDELYGKAIDLQTFDVEPNVGGRAEHTKERNEAKKWFTEQLRTGDSCFRLSFSFGGLVKQESRQKCAMDLLMVIFAY